MNNTPNDPEAFSPELSVWLTERSAGIAKDVADIVELLKNSDIDINLKGFIQLHLESAIRHATKLLAFSTEAEWSENDVLAIRIMGWEGYEEVANKYGLPLEPERGCRISLQAFVDKTRVLAQGEEATNRVLLHELLIGTDSKSSFMHVLSNALEKVTLGENSWQEFQTEIQSEIAATQTMLDADSAAKQRREQR